MSDLNAREQTKEEGYNVEQDRLYDIQNLSHTHIFEYRVILYSSIAKFSQRSGSVLHVRSLISATVCARVHPEILKKDSLHHNVWRDNSLSEFFWIVPSIKTY